MQFKIPKNSEKYYWTKHSMIKMRQYGLSAQRIVRLIRAPKRIEKGVVKNTIAVMQPVSTRRDEKGKLSWKSEVWAMYKIAKQDSKCKVNNPRYGGIGILGNQIKIISAWKYPGVSPKNNPIPEAILEEIAQTDIE